MIEELGSELIEKHRIMCGNAATFQGQERDVMLLSMVASPGDARSMAQRLYAQRFNVALSRARDRMILVRSVTSSDLRPGDLKLAVVEHFRDPMAGRPLLQGREVLDACGSDFEREFGSRLLDMGYRLRAQVPAAGFRIDFVIEGADDRRLAVELDGDQWHGPDRWAADFQRQVILERLGWVFWRCWGSSWGADPEACIEDLRQRLDTMGIKPIGASSVPAVWTEHRVIEADASPEELAASLSVDSAAAENAGGATRAAAETMQNSEKVASTPDPAAEPNTNEELLVDVGDLVVFRFDDEPDKTKRVRISLSHHDPERGIIKVDDPLANCLMGCAVEDPFELRLSGGRVRTGIVEHIERRTSIAG